MRADSVAEVQAAIAAGGRWLPRGAGTKPALSSGAEGAEPLELAGLRGVVDYDPAELTLTALAGTPLEELAEVLAEHGQFLPFDPPLVAAGATLGGALAAGVSGPAAFGAGSARDFVIGVKVVDGGGRLLSGGGRVVKNAAGFDLPKLMVGSAGRLGVVVEACCKVFPEPPAKVTLAVDCGGLEAAIELTAELARGQVGLLALELEGDGLVHARLAGEEDLLDRRLQRLRGSVAAESRVLDGAEEAAFWRARRELEWVPSASAVVVAPTRLADLPGLDSQLAAAGAERRYGFGGASAWIAWPAAAPLTDLSRLLAAAELSGVALSGAAGGRPLLGLARGGAFGQRVRDAIDPDRRFAEAWS